MLKGTISKISYPGFTLGLQTHSWFDWNKVGDLILVHVSGKGVSQLPTVTKIPPGRGEAQAATVAGS